MKDKTFAKVMRVTGIAVIIFVVATAAYMFGAGQPLDAWSVAITFGAGMFMILFSPIFDMMPEYEKEAKQ